MKSVFWGNLSFDSAQFIFFHDLDTSPIMA